MRIFLKMLMLQHIRFLVMDVDGTLTDGKIYMGQSGELFKSFDTRDGFAIREILPLLAVRPVIITARESAIVANRARELGVKELHQGCRNKLDKLQELLSVCSVNDGVTYSLANVAYIGDDLLDMQCLVPVAKAGGLAACPADATQAVKNVCQFVANHNGGAGAVRELVEYMCAARDLKTEDVFACG